MAPAHGRAGGVRPVGAGITSAGRDVPAPSSPIDGWGAIDAARSGSSSSAQGRVESDGDDVDQVMVFAVAPGGTTPPRPVARDGAFEITGLDPGEVTLIATCPSGGSIGSREVITRAGERVTLGVWTLPACPADAPASR